MKTKKFQLCTSLGILFALTVLLTLPAGVLAADVYPNKLVRLIIPVVPGGNNDIIGRMFATKLADRLGKPVVVENYGGAGSIIGTEKAAKADPDGYTLLFIASTHTINPSFYKMPFDPLKSFVPIAKLVSAPFSLVVHPSVPANSVKELVALAKQKPGQLICSSAGVGSAAHLAIELFKVKANIDFKIVQFKSAGPVVTDLLGGHSDFTIATLPQMIAHIKAGKFRLLGMGAKKRSVLVPDVPTITEAGVPYESANWWGFLAPTGTPPTIVGRLDKELKEILTLDETKKWLFDAGVEMDYLGPTEFGPFLEDQLATFAGVIKGANIKLKQ